MKLNMFESLKLRASKATLRLDAVESIEPINFERENWKELDLVICAPADHSCGQNTSEWYPASEIKRS